MVATESKPLNRRELGAWRGLLAAHSQTLAHLDEELVREHGIPLSSYEVLLQLDSAPECSLRMGELADHTLLSRSGLTRLIDRLVKSGLVERTSCESDRRGSFAQLTEEGRRRFEQARPTHLRGVREHFLSKLNPRDLDNLSAVWARVLEDGR